VKSEKEFKVYSGLTRTLIKMFCLIAAWGCHFLKMLSEKASPPSRRVGRKGL